MRLKVITRHKVISFGGVSLLLEQQQQQQQQNTFHSAMTNGRNNQRSSRTIFHKQRCSRHKVADK